MAETPVAPPPRRSNAPAAAPAEPSFGGGRLIRPLVSLRAHLLLAMFASTAIVGLGLPVAYLKGTARYETSATIQVAPRFASNLGDGDKELELQSNTQYREFVQQQVRSVNRFDVAAAALKKLRDDHVPWQEGDETLQHATQRLQWALQVKPIPDTYLIQVTYEDKDPTHMAKVVNTMVETFLTTAKGEEIVDSGSRVELLEQERQQVASSLAALVGRRTQFAEELNVTTFNENTRNPFDELLMAGRTQLAAARQRRIEAEARAGAYDSKQRPDGSAALESAAQDLVTKDNGLTAFRSGLYQRRALLMAKKSELADNYPGRAELDKELHDIDEAIDKATADLRASFSKMIHDGRTTDRYEAARVERDLGAEVAAYEAKSRAFATSYQEAVSIGGEIERLRKRKETIDNRLDFLHLETKAPGFFRLVSPARNPEQPSSGGRKKLALLVLVAALALGFLVPTVIDFLDPRVHTAAELEALVGFRPMGVIATASDAAASGLARDAIQRLATRLVHERRDHGTRVVVITPVKTDQGASLLLSALAEALEHFNLRVLMYESDALIAGQDGNPGMHLDQLTSLDTLIADTRDCADLVLVNAGPLLSNADTTLLVRAADLVLVTASASAVTKAEVRATLKHLEALDPSAVGVAMVGVPYQDVLDHLSLHALDLGTESKSAGGLTARLWAKRA